MMTLGRSLMAFAAIYTVTGTLFGQEVPPDLRLNELLARNESAYSASEGEDAIEIFNASGETIDLSNYALSDDLEELGKWRFPMGTSIAPASYLVVIASGSEGELNTNFKLSLSGETVSLSAADGTLIDQVDLPEQVTDVSYGRNSDGSWGHFGVSTFGGENDEASFFESLLARPKFSLEPGVYEGTQALELRAEEGAVIYYTLDGSNPDESSMVYGGPISLTETTVVKSVAEVDGLRSDIAGRTFLFGVSHDLPLVVLTADHFVDGVGSNNRPAIDGRVKFDFIEQDGSVPISQYAFYRPTGNSSGSLPQLNGKVEAKRWLGQESFDYAMFPDKDLKKYTRFLFRTGGQDWGVSRLRNPFLAKFLGDGDLIDIDYEGSRSAVVYLNGEYHGLTTICEDDDAAYLEDNFGFVGEYEKFGVPSFGFFRPVPWDAEDTLEQVDELIDVRGYEVYSFMQSLGDWTEGTRVWRPEGSSEPYQFLWHDFDISLGIWSSATQIHFPFVAWWKTEGPARNASLQLCCAMLQCMGYEERCLRLVDELADEIRSEVSADAALINQRFFEQEIIDFISESRYPYENLEEWEAEVEVIRDYFRIRLDDALGSYRTFIEANGGDLSDPIEVTMSVSDRAHGLVRAFGIKVSEERETGEYFPGIAIELRAEALPGYQFVRWEGAVDSESSEILPVFASDSALTAIFEPAAIPIVGPGAVVVSEINYNPLGSFETNEFLELTNISGGDLDLSGVRFTEGIDYVFPEGTVVSADARVVIRPSDYAGNLSNGGERLVLVSATSEVIEDFTYHDDDSWSEAADGLGRSLVRVAPEALLDSNLASSWRMSRFEGGSAGESDAIEFVGETEEELLAYALGGDREVLSINDLGEGNWMLSFTRVLGADEVVVGLEQSDDSLSWEDVTGVEFGSKGLPSAEGRELVEVKLPTEDGLRQFFRITLMPR